MCRYTAFARIFLILPIINYVLTAPIAVRGVHEVHVNVVDVAQDGAATSRKRWEPWGSSLTNVTDQASVPTIPAPQRLQDLQDLDHFPKPLTESSSATSSLASSVESRARSPRDSTPPWSRPSARSPLEPDSPLADRSPAPVPNPDPSLLTSTPGYSAPNSWTADESHSPSAWLSMFSPSSSWSPKFSLPSSSDQSAPSNPEYSVPSPLTGHSAPKSWSADESHLPSAWSSMFSPSSSWSPKFSSPSSSDHSPMSDPLSAPDHSLPSPLTSTLGYSAPNSRLEDESHPSSAWSPKFSPSGSWSPGFSSPSLWPKFPPPSSWSPNFSPSSSWSPKFSTISWVPDKSFTPSPDYPWPSWLLTDNSHQSPDYSPPSSTPTGPHQSSDGRPPNPEPLLANPAESASQSGSENFLDMLLNGKIRRRISGPAVNSV